MEATEMPEFSKQMKEAGEESLTSISLAISILAVLVAMVTVLGHRSHTEAVLMQSRAGDQWNYYQAKKVREDNLSLDLDMLQLQPMVDSNVSGTVEGHDSRRQRYGLPSTHDIAVAAKLHHLIGRDLGVLDRRIDLLQEGQRHVAAEIDAAGRSVENEASLRNVHINLAA